MNLLNHSFFNVAKNDSAIALSPHTPVRPTGCRAPIAAGFRPNASEV